MSTQDKNLEPSAEAAPGREARLAALGIYRWRRGLHLGHVNQVRMMMREGRQVSACRDVLKRAQRSMAFDRAAFMAEHRLSVILTARAKGGAK